MWYHVATPLFESANKAYSLAVSHVGHFELWERAVCPSGVEFRGMAGLVNIEAASTTSLTLRLTKTGECLVHSGGEQSTQCVPQTANATVTTAANLAVLEVSAFGCTLLFWRAA